jgi:hypothetical protein
VIVTIDFEASCLPRHGRSFPIEVGIAGPGFVRSWLIRRHPDWADWDWTERAERLHGITRATIEREGLPAGQVLAELADAVAGRRVVADSHIDQYWLDTLASAAGRPAPFSIDHVTGLLEEWGAEESAIASAVVQADMICPARHRAAADAQWLQALVQGFTPAIADASLMAAAPLLAAR